MRIIAGTLKGRRLAVAPGAGLRPTSERVREALFSILAESVVGARVLDAYSGSGALGFEALSRGAAHVTFVESDSAALRRLRTAAERFDVVERCSFVRGAVLDAARRRVLGGPFELILVDPPYASPEGPAWPGAAARHGLLTHGGTLVVERSSHAPLGEPGPGGLERTRSARYGGTTLDFYRRS